MSILKQQLIAARETAKALVLSIDAALAGIDVRQESPPEASGPCQHPTNHRIPIPAMGREGAWKCGLCDHEGGG